MFKKAIGVLLVVIGLLALVTPLTPGSWLAFVGLELLGIRLAWWNTLKARLNTKRKGTPANSSEGPHR